MYDPANSAAAAVGDATYATAAAEYVDSDPVYAEADSDTPTYAVAGVGYAGQGFVIAFCDDV
jgi:hypothetical protein